MKELIITIFIINLIILGINLERYLRYLIIDIYYMKSSIKNEDNLNKEIEKLKEENIMYISKINELNKKIKEQEKELYKEKKGDLPF